MIRVVALILGTLAFGRAQACEALLSSQDVRIEAANLRFSASAERQIFELRLHPREFYKFVEANKVFAIASNRRAFWSVIFEPNPDHFDRGFRVQGRRENGLFIIEQVERAYRDDEMEYYHAVAASHSLRPRRIELARAISGCRSLVVDGWAQAKLWLKHRLTLEKVTAVLNGPTNEPLLDRKRRPRLLISEKSGGRHPLHVVIGGEGKCPNLLITAFASAAQ